MPPPLLRDSIPSRILPAAAPGPALERGRFLQFNCNGILHCHAELQDFLHHHQVLVACIQRLNSAEILSQGVATVRRDRQTRVALRDLSHSSTTPSPMGCLTVAFSHQTMLRRKFWQSRPTLGEPH